MSLGIAPGIAKAAKDWEIGRSYSSGFPITTHNDCRTLQCQRGSPPELFIGLLGAFSYDRSTTNTFQVTTTDQVNHEINTEINIFSTRPPNRLHIRLLNLRLVQSSVWPLLSDMSEKHHEDNSVLQPVLGL